MPDDSHPATPARLALDDSARLAVAREIIAVHGPAGARTLASNARNGMDPAVRALVVRELAALPSEGRELDRVLRRWQRGLRCAAGR